MDERDTLIYLDFSNKLPNDTFEKEAFIRIENLQKKNPLVQINDTVFEGSYDYALGTNLFFEAVQENSQQPDPFIRRAPVQYEPIFSNIKTINLKPVKVPPRTVESTKDNRVIEFNLDWDYNTLLEKISDGSLKLQDILKSEYQAQNVENQEPVLNTAENNEHMETEQITSSDDTTATNTSKCSPENTSNPEDESILDDMASSHILEDYQRLKNLAFRPVKAPAILENMPECDPKYKEAYEYHNLEKQVLQPCDFFRTEPIDQINEETFSNCVDIDRCILYGILEKSSLCPRILTKDEKRKVFTLDNFDNLSLAGRYYVLKTHVENLEKYFENINSIELDTKDAYGRTPKQTLEIYKKLANAVENRIAEIKYSFQENIVSENKTGNIES